MSRRIIVVTHSILNQDSLPEAKRLVSGPLPVVSDLVDLGINIVQIPDVVTFYTLFVERPLEESDYLTDAFKSYARRLLVPYVDQVMEKVKAGYDFLGILSYRGDEGHRMEPETSPVMLELFRLFDRNCMATPYYEIAENLSPADLNLLISDIAEVLGV